MGLTDRLRRKQRQEPNWGDLSLLADQLGIAMVEPDPRKRETGTSYSSKGAIPVDKGVTQEVGSARTVPIREIVPELSGANAIQTYDRMAMGDAAVDISLRAGKMPIVGADFFIEPYDSEEVNKEIADFVGFNILESESAPFLSVLQDALRMMEHGFSTSEKVFEEREWTPRRKGANRRKFIMLKKMAPRLAPTVRKIVYDDHGGPTGIEHMATRADNKPEPVEIPISKLVIFANNRKGGNLEGQSLLRTAYKHWYYKDNLYKIDGIQKERHGMGFPTIVLPPTANDRDIQLALDLVSNIRTNERGGAVLPTGWELKFAELPGQPVDVMRSIDHHNAMIMLNVMAQFLLMGIAEGGGRATAGAHQDMFTKSLRFLANVMCDMFNLYVIPQLVAYNYDTDNFPQLKARNIGETKDLQQWASALANLAARNLITLDLETEQWVRSKIDAPMKLTNRQTPEANLATPTSTKKGDVQQDEEDAGNMPAPTDDTDT
jgi:Protein of unknown function (DUF935)